METRIIIERANHWLSCTYKSASHGAAVASSLYHIIQTSTNVAEVTEATRLRKRINAIVNDLQSKCRRIKGVPSVAYTPIATYNDETGETIPSVDYIQYPYPCSDKERRLLQHAEAERQFLAFDTELKSQPSTSPQLENQVSEPAPVSEESAEEPAPEPAVEEKPTSPATPSLDDAAQKLKQRFRRRKNGTENS